MAATALHLFSGRPPFERSNPVAVISQHLTAPPPRLAERRPELARFDAVLARALSKDPAARFGRCGGFAQALRQTGSGMPEAQTVVGITGEFFRSTGVTSTAMVNGGGLESLNGSDAVVLVAVTVNTSSPGESQKTYRPPLTVTKVDGAYKVSELKYPDGGN